MSERRSFYRKIGYAIAIMVLLFPLAWLSMPATSREVGGELARLRKDYRLGQTSLGEIDPASEIMKLATLGLRGVAVNILDWQATEYKKVEDWDNLSATLNQLANLTPNVVSFWKFQAWNLSYNVSVEFDDYHDRYAKVIEGINFLMRGERYNIGNAQILWDLGWFLGQKIGRADEHEQYRRLFKADDDFRAEIAKQFGDIPPDQWDNWLVGKKWYERGIEWVNLDPKRLGRKSPRIFFEGPAKSQINYAEAIEEEGYFDKARRAWLQAREEWKQFGQVPIEHSTGVMLKLGDQAALEKAVERMRAELDAMSPDARKTLAEEKRSALDPDERAVLDTPAENLTPEQAGKLYEIQAKVEVSDRDVADRVARDQPDNAKQALRLANELLRQNTLLSYTTNYRRDSNYDFWENSCNFEPTANAIDARRNMYNARKAYLAADTATAKKLYEEGFAKWRLVIDEFPMIVADESTTADDIVDYIKHYREVLDQNEETLADDFPLWDVLEKFDREQNFSEELAERKKRKSGEAEKSTDPKAPATKENTSAPPATSAGK